jgi:hypothetical protein
MLFLIPAKLKLRLAMVGILELWMGGAFWSHEMRVA